LLRRTAFRDGLYVLWLRTNVAGGGRYCFSTRAPTTSGNEKMRASEDPRCGLMRKF
jgi:hypothetical protein